MNKDLTLRENEIFNLLLAGKSSKEISYALKVTPDTIMVHRKNIYRKLDVNSISELLLKYLPAKENVITEKMLERDSRTIFYRWTAFKDNVGSHVKLIPDIEFIQGHYMETHTLCGNVSSKDYAYAGAIAFPDPFTLDAMKNMKSFSLTVLGDGNTYAAKIITTEAKADHNYYGKAFRTENGVISTLNFNIEDMSQLLYSGKKVPFINDNIEGFLVQVYSVCDFNLKFWNIEFYR